MLNINGVMHMCIMFTAFRKYTENILAQSQRRARCNTLAHVSGSVLNNHINLGNELWIAVIGLVAFVAKVQMTP